MLRSILPVALSVLLVLPVVAQPQPAPVPARGSQPASWVAPGDSATAAPSPREPAVDGDWDRAKKVARNHVVHGVGELDGRTVLGRRFSPTYRAAPPIRYNRAEGIVLGIRRDPLTLGSEERARIYGQVSYAFGLNDLRYTVGAESQLVRDAEHGLKVGIQYQEQTLTSDRWKTSYAENSLAGVGFGYDFFDYYEAEGVSVYAVQSLSPTLRLTAGFRSEEHRALARETTWSLFSVGSSRTNPAAREGRRNTVFFGLGGGRVHDFEGLPTGAAFHLLASVGEPLGGDLTYNRYQAQARAFLRLTSDTRLGLRLRGGYGTSDAPVQSQFSLGGIGSVRSYSQNAARGTRMLLGNVEYMIDGATVFDDFMDNIYLAGLLDAGWVGGPDTSFRTEDVLPSAGFSIGLDEREVRLDVTWPLRSTPTARSGPSVWLRITPNF